MRLLKIFDVHIFVRLLAKTCAHLCAFLKNFDVRIFVRLLAKVCAHLSSELLNTLRRSHEEMTKKQQDFRNWKSKENCHKLEIIRTVEVGATTTTTHYKPQVVASCLLHRI